MHYPGDYGFIPRTQLSQQMGLDHGFSDDGYLRANANIWQQSSEPHVHLAGDMGGIGRCCDGDDGPRGSRVLQHVRERLLRDSE